MVPGKFPVRQDSCMFFFFFFPRHSMSALFIFPVAHLWTTSTALLGFLISVSPVRLLTVMTTDDN